MAQDPASTSSVDDALAWEAYQNRRKRVSPAASENEDAWNAYQARKTGGTLGEKVQTVATSAVNAIPNLGSDLLRAGSIVSERVPGVRAVAPALQSAAEAIRNPVEGVPGMEGSLEDAAGSMVGNVVPMALGPEMLGLQGIKAILPGAAAMGVQQGVADYDYVKQTTGDNDKAFTALLLGTAGGTAVGLAPMHLALKGINIRSGGIVGQMFAESLAGGAVNALGTAGNDLMLEQMTDTDIDVLDNAIKSGVAGSLTVPLAQVLVQGTRTMKDMRVRNKLKSLGWDSPDTLRESLPPDVAEMIAGLAEQDLSPPAEAGVTREAVKGIAEINAKRASAAAEAEGARVRAEQAAAPGEAEYTPRGSGTKTDVPDPMSPASQPEYRYNADTGLYEVVGGEDSYTVKGTPSKRAPIDPMRPVGEPDTSGMRPYGEEYTPRGEETRRPRIDPMREVGEPNTSGMREYGEGYTPRGQITSRPTVDPMRSVSEPNTSGMVQPPDYSQVSAGPRFSKGDSPVISAKDLNPVKDRQGRTIVNIGDRMRGTLDDTGSVAGVTHKADAFDAVVEAAKQINPNIGVRMSMVPDGNKGLYSDATNVARIAEVSDFDTAAHELVGHGIENRVLGTTDSPLIDPVRGPKAMAELEELGKQSSPGGRPTNGYVSEGWAEFGRMWVNQHEDLMQIAPEMTRWFDNEFLPKQPKFAKAMDRARALADGWRFQGDVKRIQGTIAKPKSIVGSIKDLSYRQIINSVRRQITSSWDALRVYEEGKKKLGKPTPYAKRLDHLATVLAGKADSMAERFVFGRTVGMWGNATGESLESAVGPMKDHASELDVYMKAKRSEWLLTERLKYGDDGTPVIDPTTGEAVHAPHGNGVALQDAQSAIARLELKYPQIARTSDRVRAWYERVWDYVVEACPEMAIARDAMRQPGEFYIPQHKEFDAGARPQARSVKGAARNLEMGKRLSEGAVGARETKPLLQQLQTEAADMFRKAHERMLLNSLVESGKDAGIGGLFEDVTATLTGQGEGYVIGQEIPPPDVPVANVQNFFAPPSMDAAGRAVFKRVEPVVKPDGTTRMENRAYAIHPEIYDAVVGLDPNAARLGLGYLGAVGRYFRNAQIGGAIVLNPNWVFFKNVAYDPMTAYINTRYSWAFRDMVIDWVPNLVRTALHEFTNGRLGNTGYKWIDKYTNWVHYKWIDVYNDMGARVSGQFASEQMARVRAHDVGSTPIGGVKDAITGKRPRVDYVMEKVEDTYDVVGRIMGISDEAPRIWELKRAAKKVGWKPGEPMTADQFIEMSMACRRVTGNRAEAGVAVNKLNTYIAFMRAAVVQPRDSYRAITAEGNRLRSAFKIASLAGLGAVYWYMRKDDKRRLSQTAKEQFSTMQLPLTDIGYSPDNLDDSVVFPLDPNAALVIKGVEFGLDAMYQDNPLEASEIAGAVVQKFAPPWMPALLETPVKLATNRREFGQDAEIYNPNIPPEQDVRPWTPKLAEVLGGITGTSPRALQYAIEGIWGAPGKFALNGFGLAPSKSNMSATSNDVLEGNWFRRGGSISLNSRWVNGVYAAAREADMNHRRLGLAEPPEAMLLRMQLEDTVKAINAARAIAETYEMPAAERQKLYKFANSVAEQTCKDLKSNNPNLGQARAARMQLESRNKMLGYQAGKTPR